MLWCLNKIKKMKIHVVFNKDLGGREWLRRDMDAS